MHFHVFCAGLGAPLSKPQILSEEEGSFRVYGAMMGELLQLRIEDGLLGGQSLKVATMDKQKFVNRALPSEHP